MRGLITTAAVVILAGCAAAPSSQTTKVYDHKYNQTYYVAKQSESPFVGTSAKVQAEKVKPSWYKFGHP